MVCDVPKIVQTESLGLVFYSAACSSAGDGLGFFSARFQVALTPMVEGCKLPLAAQEVADALHGLQRIQDSAEARGLLAALLPKVQGSKGRFTGRQVGQALFGLQSLGDSAEVRELVMALIPKVTQERCGTG